MNPEQVAQIRNIRDRLATMATGIKPANDDEWNALDRISSAHKHLRAIEYGKLGQIPMPIGSGTDVACPTCHGEGTVMTDGGERETTCPQCLGRCKVSESSLQRKMDIEAGTLVSPSPAGEDNNNGASEVVELTPEDAALFREGDGEGEGEDEPEPEEAPKRKRGRKTRG